MKRYCVQHGCGKDCQDACGNGGRAVAGGFEVMGRGFGEVCFGGGGERWTFWVLLWCAVEACVVVVLEMR